MKNLFYFLLVAITFAFVGCQDDSLLPSTKAKHKDDISVRSKTGTGKGESNGRWLRIPSQKDYQGLYDYLVALDAQDKQGEKSVILVEDKEGKYGTTYDPNPALAQWEQTMNHRSLRRGVLLAEDTGLRNGKDPGYLFMTSDDRDITDIFTQTLHSDEGVIQIGSSIYFAATPGLIIEVQNDNEKLMIDILDNGTDVIYDGDNIKDVKLRPKETFFGVNKACTADFGVFKGIVDEEGNTARYTFLWNMGDISGAIDPEFTWTFGDGTTSTSTSPFIFKAFDNLKPKPSVNNFNVCLTAKYKVVDEEGNETECMNSSCQTITIEYDGPTDDEPLFTCDDAQLVGSILATLNIVDLLDVTTTPGNATEVCVNASNLVLGSAALMDALTFEWTFQGQTAEGIHPCFTAPCDGEYDLTLTIKVNDTTTCIVLSEKYKHNEDANCQGKKDFQQKESYQYTYGGKKSKVTFRAKHQTNYDNGWFNWNKNQIETQQTSYKKGFLGLWYKTNRRHEIRLEGNVYPKGDACACEGTPDWLDPSVDYRIKTEKNTKYYKQMFHSSHGIFCKVNDPYQVSFDEQNGAVTQTYYFPQ